MDLQQFIDEKQQSRAEWAEKKQSERSEMMELLDSSVQDITTIPEQYAAFLKFQASTASRYSPSNAALILAQKPEASLVGSLEHWNGLGRKVSRGETGISIMAPKRYDYMRKAQHENPETGEVSTTAERKRGLGFEFVRVFDVSQTTGKALPEPVRLTGENMEKGVKALIGLCPVPIRVEENLPAPALYDSQNMELLVQKDAPPNALLYAMAKEITHAQMHGGGRYGGYERRDYELYANSVAQMYAGRFGLECPAQQFGEVRAAFEGLEPAGRREMLDMLHDFAKTMGDRTAKELGLPVQQRHAMARSSGTAR